MQVTFMKLVENDQPDIFQFGIGLQAARQDSLGEHLDTGFRRNSGFEPDTVTDCLSRRFAAQLGHARARRARRQPPRFQHQDGASGQPGFVKQREGNVGGLARAGRRLQHHGMIHGERLAQ